MVDKDDISQNGRGGTSTVNLEDSWGSGMHFQLHRRDDIDAFELRQRLDNGEYHTFHTIFCSGEDASEEFTQAEKWHFCIVVSNVEGSESIRFVLRLYNSECNKIEKEVVLSPREFETYLDGLCLLYSTRGCEPFLKE